MTQHGAPTPGMGTRAGRKAQSIPSDGRGQACSCGPSQQGSKPKVRAASVPGTPSMRALEEQKGCWGDEEEEAGFRGCQWTCQGWSRAASRGGNGLARAEPEPCARDGGHRDPEAVALI